MESSMEKLHGEAVDRHETMGHVCAREGGLGGELRKAQRRQRGSGMGLGSLGVLWTCALVRVVVVE